MGKKAFTSISIIFIIILLSQPMLTATPKDQANIQEYDFLLEGSYIQQDGPITIIQVNGSSYQMGFQHGYLLREWVQQNIRAYLANAPTSRENLLDIWNTMFDYIPTHYQQELQGIADGANISIDDLGAAYAVIIYGDMGCFSISCWGNATKNNTLLHARSFDLPMNVQDPVSHRYVHENHLLLIRKPTTGYTSISPTVAGSMHGGGGFNQQGIALGMQVCWSKDQTVHGIPGMIRTQMVLDHAKNATQAIEILTKNRTLGWNFIVSDTNQNQGYAVETTANHSYHGTDHHPTEAKRPFWSIENMVRRTNFFIDPTIASTQRDHYKPNGLLNFWKLLQREEYFFAIWQSYKAVSTAFESKHGTLTASSLMQTFRASYKGETNLLLKFIISQAEDTSFNHAWNMWVVEPETGEFYVSFASKEDIAYDTPIFHYNAYDLIS